MKNDTINYYLLFNSDKEVLVFYDKQNNEYLYPQKTEKILDETFEDRFYKLNMLLKEKNSSNDTLIYINNDKIYTRKEPFMESLFEIIKTDESTKIESYSGEYKLIEYSEERYFLEIKYLLCNYYAKYIELSDINWLGIRTLCETYNYDVDFVSLEDLYNNNQEFANSKSYLRKLQNILK